MRLARDSGILLHPTSLPGPFGIGDLGNEAYRFADFLAASGQSLWQVLPLGPTGYGDSPYACYSAFAGNTLLISPQKLFEEGLLAQEDLAALSPLPSRRVDFQEVSREKDLILQKAFESFRRQPGLGLHQAFESFAKENQSWLDDYALFRVLKILHGGLAWHDWERPLLWRMPEALGQLRTEHREEIEAQKFYQFVFFRQWFALKNYCNRLGLRIIGDVPIFVALDSADVWTNPEQFKLDPNGAPLVVAGVPPDYFSATGQLWGNPIYNWEQMLRDGFRWWVERIRATLRLVDIARIDHFRGFAACWEIPAGDQTAEHGQWINSPGRELFTAIRNALGEVPIIAEDLGVITPDVGRLRQDFGFPGMRILQFAFGSDATNQDLPHNYETNTVVYTGTHDNNTTVGWFSDTAGADSTRTEKQIDAEREFCLKYLNSDGEAIEWDFIRAAFSSVADTALVPLQDVIGLGSEARMNLPNSKSGNWSWRFQLDDLNDSHRERLRELSELYGRNRKSAVTD